MGGVAWEYVAAPLLGAITAAIVAWWLAALVRSAWIVRVIGAVSIVAVMSYAFHDWAIAGRWISGSYLLPAGFDATMRSDDDLVDLVFARNSVTGAAALQELMRRGSRRGLVEVLDRGVRGMGSRYFESTIIQDVAEALAARRDPRAVSVLHDMLRSDESVRVIRFERGTQQEWISFPTRERARDLLRDNFGEHVTVETERRVR